CPTVAASCTPSLHDALPICRLRAVIEEDYRDQIAALCYRHAQASGDISLVLYDVTTLYFEAEDEDDLRKVGFSNYVDVSVMPMRSEEHTSELQSRFDLVCRL